jgi:hypothetical protein
MEIRYIRYVATNALTQVLEPVESGHVLRLRARRSISNRTSRSEPLTWVQIDSGEQLTVEVDFLSLKHGRFVKNALQDIVKDEGLVDVPVQELDVLVDKGAIGKAFAELLDSEGLKTMNYVAHFEEYPLRREREDNDFTKFVRERFEDKKLGRLGFEPASLDLKYVLPSNTWKEVVKGHLSKDYQADVDRWKAYFERLETDEVRKLALSIFPKEICRGREYQRLKGDVWTLVRHGDI